MADEGWKDFARVLKYFRHTLEGFARRVMERGAEESWKTFAGTIKYLRHLWEDFCRDHEIF